jgi:hypothetical protein
MAGSGAGRAPCWRYQDDVAGVSSINSSLRGSKKQQHRRQPGIKHMGGARVASAGGGGRTNDRRVLAASLQHGEKAASARWRHHR